VAPIVVNQFRFGTQQKRSTIQKAYRMTEPHSLGIQPVPNYLPGVVQRFLEHQKRKPLPSLAVRGRALRPHPLRQWLRVSPVQMIYGPTGHVTHHRIAGVIRVEPLVEETPYQKKGGEQTFIEPPPGRLNPSSEEGKRQHLRKDGKQLGKAGLAFRLRGGIHRCLHHLG
jgi:hypothetical protein